MAWEHRARGGPYYYRTARVAGGFAREYLGNGPAAVAAARQDAERRARAAASASRMRSERRALDEQERRVRAHYGAVEGILRDELMRAGYRRHARGEWRRVRAMAKGGTAAVQAEPTREERVRRMDERLDGLMRRADAGDAAATGALRAMADEVPSLWGQMGDLGRQADRSLQAMVSGKNAVVGEAIGRRMAAMRRELAGPDPTPLERLLVDRIVACWVALHWAECHFAQAQGEALSWERSQFLEGRLDRASRRYLAAIRSLATTRRLLAPAVQVNVGQHQVNVSGTAVVAERAAVLCHGSGDAPLGQGEG